MTTDTKIGWIGAGKMGAPMALNLLAAGYAVGVYNRTRAKTEALADAGATVADSLAGLAANSDVVISMINDDAALEAVATAPGGVLENAKPGTIYVDMSTVSPAASARVAAAFADSGMAYVRAPVSGSTHFAQRAQLVVLASGPEDAFAACLPLFDIMGKKTVYLGGGEEARYQKLVLNMMVGITAAMVGEALTLGSSGKLDWPTMIDVIGNSPLASPLLAYKSQMLKDRDFSAAFSVDQMAKDFDIILATANATGAPAPITALVRQFWGVMKAQGKGGQDMFAYVAQMEELAGLDKG